MQAKPSLKSLIEDCLAGNFDKVYKNVLSKSISFETISAIKVIVALCNACHNNLKTPQNLNERDLVKLVKCLLKFIQVPSNESYDSYAQSAFHILRLLIEKKNYECIVQLEELFIPDFMPLILTEKHQSVYQSMCKSIYNVIVKMAQTKDLNNVNWAFKLTHLLSQLYKKIDSKTGLLESSHNCILVLVNLNASINKLLQFYQHLLTLIDRIKDPSLYTSLMNNFSFLYTHMLKNEKFALATICYKATFDKLSTLFKGRDYEKLWEIVAIIEWINPENAKMSQRAPVQSHTCLKNFYKQYQSTANLQTVCDLISSVAFTVLLYYKKNNKWAERVDVHSEYYNFLNDVSLIMAKTPYSCHCKKCPTATNLNEALRTLNTIASLGRLTITSCDVSRSYKTEILRYLEKQIDYLSILQANDCEKWEKYWYDCGGHLYTVGVHLHNKKDPEMSGLFLKKFVHAFINFEGFQSKVIDKTYLTFALNTISDSYFENRDYEKCLLVTSLAVISSDSPKNEIYKWIKAKAACRDSTIEENCDLQEMTLVSIFQKSSSELASLLPEKGLKLDTQRKISLLTYELRQYNAKWKSKIPMAATFRELSRIASTQIAAEVFVEIWGDGEMMVHETLPKLLQDTIKRVEIENIAKKNMLLAHLYFLQHKYRVKDTIVKHCDEMERTMNMTKIHEPESGVPPTDPNDECDLVSSYECLKLSRYLNMMKELNKSLDLTFDWLSSNHINSCEDTERLYKLLSRIGHEYSLHGHVVKSLQAFQLALKVAENPLDKLRITGFIIEQADVRKPLLKNLILEAEKGVNLLKVQGHFQELVAYFLCKAQAFFYVDFETAYGAFREALKFRKGHQMTNILQARIHLLEHKFVMLPCGFEVEGHREYSLVKIHQANQCINTYYNETPGTSSYDMRIFFDIYETLAKMYHDLRLPREVRCYSRDAVVIAQKMVLPFRTTCFLYYLAYADINTCRLDDCRVKLKDLSDILGVTKGKSTFAYPNQAQEKAMINEILDNLAGEMKEMMLDVPEKMLRPTSCGSPSFAVETFKVPSFLSHEDDCECFYCSCVEYHQFVLKRTYLNGLFYEHEGNLSVAKDFFCGSVKVYEHLKSKQDVYWKKVSKKVSGDLVPVLTDRLAETYCFTLLEYGNFAIRRGRITDAKSVNKKLLDYLERYSLKYIYLYNEALAQTLDIITLSQQEDKPKPRSISFTEHDEVLTVKTPQSKVSKVLISPNLQPEIAETFKIFPKFLKFDLSDTEDDPTNKEVKKGALPKNLPPFLNLGAKTPAPSSSKIKVYTKTARKAKPVLGEVPTFKTEFAAANVEVSTPEVKSTIDLSSRTKLLTTRLKNSSRKRGNGVTDENEARTSLRQNLFGQMNEDEAAVGNGALRRSERNRK